MPRYQLPWQATPPPVEEVAQAPNLLREGARWFTQQSGEDLDRAMALQELELISPDLAELYKIEEATEGRKRSAGELYTNLRQLREPGWEGSGSGDKAAGLGLFALQYPVAGALGAVAPGLGHAAGWGAMRHMAHLADPDLAGASLAWDVAGAAGAKALGTAGSMLYRSKIMPKLAQKGLTSKELHPVSSRVLDWAETAMDPLVGPKAKNVGLPRWVNRKLQKVGRPDIAPKVPAGHLPAGQQALDLPGQQTIPGMRPRTQGKLPSPLAKVQEGDQLKYTAELDIRPSRHRAYKATTGKGQMDVFRSALEDLPPEPEQLTTLSEVAQAAMPVEQMDLGVPEVPRQLGLGMPKTSRFKPTEIPGPTTQPGKQMGLDLQQPAHQAAIPGIGTPEVIPQRPLAKQPSPGPTGSVSLKGPQKPSAGVRKAAVEIIRVAGPGKKLTWKQYAAGLQKATGLKRREMHGVLRVHKALADSYGETPDEMIGRMFRGVMTQEEHATAFPGISKWAKGARGPVGVSHWMEDGRAILAFSDRVRMGKVSTVTQLETALHEPLHVFYRWMPEREKAVLTKALGGKKGQAWTDDQEHQAITWALEYLRGGKAPTKRLAGTFERLRNWLTRLLTRGKKGKVPEEVEAVLNTMLSPEGYKRGRGVSRALKTRGKARATRG